jgi:hypothetical protein
VRDSRGLGDFVRVSDLMNRTSPMSYYAFIIMHRGVIAARVIHHWRSPLSITGTRKLVTAIRYPQINGTTGKVYALPLMARR